MQNVLKNKKVVMIIAMVLMVALVAGMGAMTYSRYVSSADMGPAATATVAKWGYVLNINANNMFADNYETEGTTEGLAVKSVGDDVVKVTSTGSIVAPGTTGSMTITATGEAEVLAALSIVVQTGYADVTLEKASGGKYQPVKWTLNDGTNNVVNKGTLEELVTALGTFSHKIEAGDSIEEELTISWEWALETGATPEEKAENNKLDTILGLLAAGKSLSAEQTALIKADTTPVTSITFDISATVKQIQD